MAHGLSTFEVVRGQWSFALMEGWGQQILEARVALLLPCAHSRLPGIVAFGWFYRVFRG